MIKSLWVTMIEGLWVALIWEWVSSYCWFFPATFMLNGSKLLVDDG